MVYRVHISRGWLLAVFIFCCFANLHAQALGLQGKMEEEEPLSPVIPLKTVYAPQEREFILGFDIADSDEALTWTTTLELEYSFYDRIEFDLELPFVARFAHDNEGEADLESVGDKAGIGDIETGLKLKLLESKEDAFNLAGGFGVTWPTGSTSDSLGEGKTSLGPVLAFSKRLGPVSILGDVGYKRTVATRTEEADEEVKDEFHVDGAIAYRFPIGLSPILEINNVFNSETIVLITPGLIYQVRDRFEIRCGVQIPVSSDKEFDWNTIFQLLYDFG